MSKADYFIGRYLRYGAEDVSAVFAAAAAEISRAAAAQRTGRRLTEAGYKLYAAFANACKHARKAVAGKAAAGCEYRYRFSDMTAKAVD